MNLRNRKYYLIIVLLLTGCLLGPQPEPPDMSTQNYDPDSNSDSADGEREDNCSDDLGVTCEELCGDAGLDSTNTSCTCSDADICGELDSDVDGTDCSSGGGVDSDMAPTSYTQILSPESVQERIKQSRNDSNSSSQ